MRYYKKVIGEKCYLSPMNAEDAEKYAEWVNDFDITKTLLISPQVISADKEKELIKKLSEGNNFAIINKENDTLIGNCGIFGISNTHRTAEVGIFIGEKSLWNKGYGTEALKLLLDFCFSILNLHNVTLRVLDINKRAQKAYEKCGFKVIGRRREPVHIAGKRFDEIHMDILASEYESIYFEKALEI